MSRYIVKWMYKKSQNNLKFRTGRVQHKTISIRWSWTARYRRGRRIDRSASSRRISSLASCSSHYLRLSVRWPGQFATSLLVLATATARDHEAAGTAGAQVSNSKWAKRWRYVKAGSVAFLAYGIEYDLVLWLLSYSAIGVAIGHRFAWQPAWSFLGTQKPFTPKCTVHLAAMASPSPTY
jgi:hypothetical protein